MTASWNFVNEARKNAGYPQKMLCPCRDCRNLSHQYPELVYDHLVIRGMDPTYTTWFHHCEQPSAQNEHVHVEMSDAYNLYTTAYEQNDDFIDSFEQRNEEFIEVLEDAETPLFLGCTKYTKLAAITTLYSLKAKSEWTDYSFGKLLAIVHDMLPNS